MNGNKCLKKYKVADLQIKAKHDEYMKYFKGIWIVKKSGIEGVVDIF